MLRSSRCAVLIVVAVWATTGRPQAQTAPGTYTDPRDRYEYKTVSIGGQRWFAENLRYKTSDSRCYEADEARYSGWIDPFKADSSRAMGRNSAFWTSTEAPPDESSATAWHRDIATDRNSIWRSPVNVTYWLSVRCVR